MDSGFVSGDEVSTFYDAMLAKVMAWAPTREQAIRMLVAALRRARIHGVTTNRDQLVEILTDPVFVAGEMTTTWLESRPRPLASPVTRRGGRTALRGDALCWPPTTRRGERSSRAYPPPGATFVSQPQRTTFRRATTTPSRVVGHGRDGFAVDGVTVLEVSPTHARLEVDGRRRAVRRGWTRSRFGRRGCPAARGVRRRPRSVRGRLREVPRFTDPADAVASGSLLAPMPGTVVAVKVEAGAEVAAGDVVLVLEAMKMQHTVTAPHDGTVAEINVEPGSQVASGEVLAVVATKEVEENA